MVHLASTPCRFPKFHRVFVGPRLWRDEMWIVSPQFWGRNIHFNPGIETLVVEILNSVPAILGTQYKFQPCNRDSGIETLARVPGAWPFPSARAFVG
eukprot:5449247-Heterocapsa_arctica.AAC.1